MEGKHLIVSVSSIPPYVDYTINEDNIILEGAFGQLWTILESRLGFTSQYKIETYSVGVQNFQNRLRDVLLRPTVISSEDVENFEFTFPVGSTWYELYLKDSDEINSSKSYIRNWSLGIWILTAAMIFLFIVILYGMLYIAHKYSIKDLYVVPNYERVFRLVQYFSHVENQFYLPKNWRKKKTEYQKLRLKNERSLGNCFTTAFALFCAQGIPLYSKITSIRILLLTFLIFGMIMYNAYSALLVSQLTLGERFLPFDTLEEIPYKGQEYSLCVRPESYPYLYFTVNNTQKILKEKWKNLVNEKPCPEDGILSVTDMCEPYVAFLETPPVMKKYFARNFNCKMTNLKGRYFHINFSILILKGFEEEAKRELNMEILRYRELGILSYLKEKWIQIKEPSTSVDNQKLQVTFEHIEGVIIVYAFCIAFSCSIFIFEVIIHIFIKKQIYKIYSH